MTWNEFKSAVDEQIERLSLPGLPAGDLEIQYIEVGYPRAIQVQVDDDDLCILDSTPTKEVAP